MSFPPQFPGNQPGGFPPPNQPPGSQQPGPQQAAPQYGQQAGQQFGGQPQHAGPQYGQPPGAPHGGYQPPPKQGISTGIKILLGVIFAFFVLIAGCSVAVSLLASRAGSAIEDFAEEAEANGQLAKDAATITACEYDGTGTAIATVEITSPFAEEKGIVNIEVNFLEGSTVVGSGLADFSNLGPGQLATSDAVDFTVPAGTTTVTCEIADGTVF